MRRRRNRIIRKANKRAIRRTKKSHAKMNRYTVARGGTRM